MLAMRAMLPPNANWSCFGVGAQHFPTVAMAVVNGGHVRVGLEDNLYMAEGVLAEGNAPLVARAARIIREIGAEVFFSQRQRVGGIRRWARAFQFDLRQWHRQFPGQSHRRRARVGRCGSHDQGDTEQSSEQRNRRHYPRQGMRPHQHAINSISRSDESS
jgi:hypothetical protein